MDSNDELKGTDIKSCRCYYFYDIIKVEYLKKMSARAFVGL